MNRTADFETVREIKAKLCYIRLAGREGSGGVGKALVEQFFGRGEGGGLVFDDGGGVVEEGADRDRGGAVFGGGESEGLVFFGALAVVLSKGAFGGGGGVIEGALALEEALAWLRGDVVPGGRLIGDEAVVGLVGSNEDLVV
ncbi:hypothetical protein Syun_009416 [Stephania yunnanensis]|uniref:Uncharacterized protein n=1 Tax=Stephania yunnanensis TaxID=152371 RepID=A0AAP0KEL1_9MAGN